MGGASSVYSVILHGDEHADLAACYAAEAVVPADEVVILGVDLREGYWPLYHR